MVIVASIYLRFYIEVGVGNIFTDSDSDSTQNSFRLHDPDSDSTAVLFPCVIQNEDAKTYCHR
jgi:hypothetical protein